ncbi:MAG TPA: hypothetical protein VE732_09265 [Nitrososphaera sp.]|nr:hypothetical protein [Nitrososphaera sp.]
MSVWRRVALEKIPSLRRLIEDAPNVMALWIELQLKLAYGDLYQSPPNEKMIAGIFDYASWCLNKSHNWDTKTAVVCAFYEHLPKMKEARADLPNRMSMEDFLKLKEDFRYLLSDEEHEEFVKEFVKRKAKPNNSFNRTRN